MQRLSLALREELCVQWRERLPEQMWWKEGWDEGVPMVERGVRLEMALVYEAQKRHCLR